MESVFYSSSSRSTDSDRYNISIMSPSPTNYGQLPRSQDHTEPNVMFPVDSSYLIPEWVYDDDRDFTLSGYSDNAINHHHHPDPTTFYTYGPGTIYHDKDIFLQYPSRPAIPVDISPTPEFEHFLSLTPPATIFDTSPVISVGLTTPPDILHLLNDSDDSKKVKKQKTESRMPLPELYARMGLENNHDEARKREQKIFDILQQEGFELGYKTWIRDTTEDERKKIIDKIFTETFDSYGYDRNLIEIIVRRGSYYLMQGRLRRIRRGSRRVQKERTLAVH